MTTAGDETVLVEHAGDLRGAVAVQVEELDALEADRGHLVERRGEVARALVAHGVEHQAEARHTVSSRCAAMKSRYQWKARLRDALERRVVDVDDPEPLRVALGPLEVVEQRPDVVALHRHAGGDRARDRVEVAGEVVPPLRIGDRAVVHTDVAERRAVLGHVDRARRVVAGDADEALVEALGIDLPAHVGVGRARDVGDREAARGVGVGEDAEVVVHAEEVERRRDRLEVACPYGRRVGHVGRVLAAEERVEEPAVHLPVDVPGGVHVGVGRRSPARRE